jgi:hypothetical protein
MTGDEPILRKLCSIFGTLVSDCSVESSVTLLATVPWFD